MIDHSYGNRKTHLIGHIDELVCQMCDCKSFRHLVTIFSLHKWQKVNLHIQVVIQRNLFVRNHFY